MTEKWVTIREYAEHKNKSVPQIYYDIRFGKIPKEDYKIEEYDFVMRRKKMLIKICQK